MTSLTAPPHAGPRHPRPTRTPPIVRRLLADSAYLLVGFPLAVASFVLVIVGVRWASAG